MNLRQRRGLMFLGGSALFLLIGAASLGGYVQDVNERVGPMVDVAVLRRDVDAYTPLTESDVGITQVPRRWVPDRVVGSETETVGLVAPIGLQSGTYLTEDILVAGPELAPGQREIAILIDAETGVAGKVEPGSRVDIVATFTDDATGATRSEIIVPDAEVLDVGDLRAGQDNEDDEGFEQGRVVPVTFALSVEDTLVLTYAESFAEQVRLARVAPTEGEPIAPEDRVYTGD